MVGSGAVALCESYEVLRVGARNAARLTVIISVFGLSLSANFAAALFYFLFLYYSRAIANRLFRAVLGKIKTFRR